MRKSYKALQCVPNRTARIRYLQQSRDLRDGYSCKSEGSQKEQLKGGEMRCSRADKAHLMSGNEGNNQAHLVTVTLETLKHSIVGAKNVVCSF